MGDEMITWVVWGFVALYVIIGFLVAARIAASMMVEYGSLDGDNLGKSIIGGILWPFTFIWIGWLKTVKVFAGVLKESK